MITGPAQIRAEVDAVLSELPGGDPETELSGTDIDAMGRRLEEAHQLLVRALESVEKS